MSPVEREPPFGRFAGGIVLHFDRMNRLKLLDASEMLGVVEPGITNWELRALALAEGLFYQPDPSSTKVCTLGAMSRRMRVAPAASSTVPLVIM